MCPDKKVAQQPSFMNQDDKLLPYAATMSHTMKNR